MNQNFFVLVLCLLLLAGTALSSKVSSTDNRAYLGDWQTNHMQPSYRQADTIDIDDNKGDFWEGSSDYSGDGYDDDEDRSNDDDDDDDGNGSGGPTECELLRTRLNEEGTIGLYIPRCTETGQFQPKQCHYNTGQCWCVDEAGLRIDGSQRLYDEPMDCPYVKSTPTPRGPILIDRKPPQSRPNTPAPDHRDDTEDFYDSSETNEGKGPSDSKPKGAADPVTTRKPDTEGGSGDRMRGKPAVRIIMEPGILAGIIGGAVVGLLCTVLLMMFIVYRMRKKDEGSYALDDPKQKARDREFFA